MFLQNLAAKVRVMATISLFMLHKNDDTPKKDSSHSLAVGCRQRFSFVQVVVGLCRSVCQHFSSLNKVILTTMRRKCRKKLFLDNHRHTHNDDFASEKHVDCCVPHKVLLPNNIVKVGNINNGKVMSLPYPVAATISGLSLIARGTDETVILYSLVVLQFPLVAGQTAQAPLDDLLIGGKARVVRSDHSIILHAGRWQVFPQSLLGQVAKHSTSDNQHPLRNDTHSRSSSFTGFRSLNLQSHRLFPYLKAQQQSFVLSFL